MIERSLPYLLGVLLLFFLASLYHRHTTLDDAWFAEQAYWFAKDGYVHSELTEGYPIFAGKILVYHKLHIWQGAAAYKFFGWNAYIFKAIPLLYLLIFIGLVFNFIKRIAPSESRKFIFILFLFLLFIYHHIFQQGFEFRPDVMMMCTGFISYLLLLRAQSEVSAGFAILSGLFAGITALFHLNGLIFILSGGLLLIIGRQYKLIIWFGIGAIAGFLPYFYEIKSISEFKHYLYLLRHDPAVHEEDRTALGWLKKLATEYRRFTHHVYESTYLIIFLITLACNWSAIRRNEHHKNLLIYTLFLTIFIALLTTGSKTMYLLYSMPYVLLLVSIYFTRVISIRKIGPLFLVMVTLYCLTNLDRDHGVIVDHKTPPASLYARIVAKYHINEGQHIFAPSSFIFNEMGKVHIQGYVAYLLKYQHHLAQVTLKNVFNDIYRRKKSFAILGPHELKDLKLSPQTGKVYFGYQCLGQEDVLYIFQRIPGRSTGPGQQG